MGPRRVYVVGHRNPDTDTVCSAIAYAELERCLGERDVVPARAGELDAETAHVLARFGVPVPELLTDATGLDLILVDHSEVGQALPHIERANVLEIWEHHRIGDLRLAKPIFFHCEPVGATATLIAEQYFARGVPVAAPMAGILLASILSDTAAFRSPTVTAKDRDVAARLALLAEVEPQSFGEELLRIKARAMDRKSAADIVGCDFKEFDFGDLRRVGIGQVQVMQPGAIDQRKPEILREMRARRDAGGLVQLILMITDVPGESSVLWFVGERRELFERAFGALVDDAVHLPGCMSRKKQVVPPLEEAFAAEGVEPC
ncbi:MAG: manganese-dependent inorganic pyrophosphatase [Myxococcales bacterium]|nr:manganese-dependent inorganic pyrophosphatase [Myxococcales bacterium]